MSYSIAMDNKYLLGNSENYVINRLKEGYNKIKESYQDWRKKLTSPPDMSASYQKKGPGYETQASSIHQGGVREAYDRVTKYVPSVVDLFGWGKG